jgi:hypothetical protein
MRCGKAPTTMKKPHSTAPLKSEVEPLTKKRKKKPYLNQTPGPGKNSLKESLSSCKAGSMRPLAFAGTRYGARSYKTCL